MNRTSDYYIFQRWRVIKKKSGMSCYRGLTGRIPKGVFFKNKFHCPARSRQIKTTPKAKTFSYGDHKHNWSRRDARNISGMNERLAEINWREKYG